MTQKQRIKTDRSATRNQLRIIGGVWRGRKLAIADVDGLRPTSDRIRETLFNWLAPEIAGSRCLDLFAGSGALGLEALSRGATHLVMVERDPLAVAMLKNNCVKLEAKGVQIVQADALQWLDLAGDDERFGVVFLDPPFTSGLLQPCLEKILASGMVDEGGLIYVETPATASLPLTDQSVRLHREKFAGNVAYRLLRII